MQNGPAMHRLIELLDALDKGEWSWERVGPVRKPDSWIWHGEPEIKRQAKPTLVVDVLAGRIGWQG